jgi:hypothetical protein
MRTSKVIIEVSLVAAALLAVLLFAWWADVSRQVAHVTFSKDRYCKLQFHQWYSGRSILSYYENGACVGHVQLNNDLFNDPLAMFPGPDGRSVVCLSWPDTFDAAFTVDFSKRSSAGCTIPERLRLEGQEAVDFSNFEVRACTTKEVEFVRRFIRNADLKTLGDCIRNKATEEARQDTLTFLAWATSPNNWTDPVLKNAAPLLLPDDQSLAEGTR